MIHAYLPPLASSRENYYVCLNLNRLVRGGLTIAAVNFIGIEKKGVFGMSANEWETASGKSGYSMVHVGLALAGTVVAAWVLSFVYGLAGHYSPLVYLNLLLAYVFGWLVGRIGQGFLRKYRIDGKMAATAVGLVGGLCAVYLAWPAYFWVVTDFNFSTYKESLVDPVGIWETLRYISENPLWSIKSGKNSSPWPAAFYFLVWAGELVLIVGVAVKVCRSFVRDNLLCDHCRDWVAPSGDFARLAIPAEGQAALMAALPAGDVSALPDLPRVSDEEAEAPGAWLEVKGFACPNCQGKDEYVTVSLVSLDVAKKKDSLERSEKVLARLIRIDPDTERRLFEPAPAAENADTDARDKEDAEVGEAGDAERVDDDA